MPFEAAPSEREFLVFAEEVGIVSEHETSQAAVKSLIQFVATRSNPSCAIYRRSRDGWQKF